MIIAIFYDGANFKTGQTVTAIGIQDGDTLSAVAGITNNLMENELDRETAWHKVGCQVWNICFFHYFFTHPAVGRCCFTIHFRHT